MEEIVYDCIVVGGGISGISFAHNLKKAGKNVLILEEKEKIGGQIKSEFSDHTPTYWRELGAHTCYNSYTHLLSMLKDIDCTDIIQPLGKGSYVVYSDGKIKKMFAELSFIPLMFNGPRIFFTSKENRTVKEYFSKIVGKSNYEKLFSCLFRAVISQSADNYPAELFLKRRKDRFEDFPRKYTFREGIASLLNTIVEKDNLTVLTNSKVDKIERTEEGKLYKVTTSEGNSYTTYSLGLASDTQNSAKLLSELEPKTASLLSTVPLFHSESLSVVVPKEKIDLQAVAGIISLSEDFHSAVSRDLIEDPKLRSFTFHFEKGEKSDQEKMEVVCKVLKIVKEDVLDSKLVNHVLPSLRIEHLNMADKVASLRTDENIYILGNYFYGLSLEDCVNRSVDEFARYEQNNA